MNLRKLIFFSILLSPCWPGKIHAQNIARTLDFYGDSLTIQTDTAFSVAFNNGVSQKTVCNFYENLNSSDCQPLVTQLQNYRKKHLLNDWFYYQLIRKVAQSLSPKQENYERYTLYKWFLLGKSGYDVSLSYSGKHLLFYVRSDENIYDIPYFVKNGIQYVCLNYHDYGKIDFEKETLYELETHIPEGTRAFSYIVTQVPDFRPETYSEKDIEFSYHEQTYHFRVKVNPQVQNIFQNYPVVDFSTYFNIPVSKETHASLIPLLKAQTSKMSQQQGVDYLMHFTRNSFDYASDRDFFGKEKRLSPEQTLLFNKSDCDDRAALFFYLVKEVYNLPMIVLQYPTHVIVAVHFDKQVGKSVVYNGRPYTVCEATPQEQDLNIGQMARQYRRSQFNVVYAYEPQTP